jgi:single-stranded-DNA-specific exonuclease
VTLPSAPPLEPDDLRLTQAARAYRQWQWAHHYRTLDDAGWARSVHAMLGVPVPAPAAAADAELIGAD